MGLIKTLAVVGGGAYALNQLSKDKSSNRSANVAVKSTVDANEVKKAIAADPNLLSIVRGEKGDTGAKGESIYSFATIEQIIFEIQKPSYNVGEVFLEGLTGDLWKKKSVNDVLLAPITIIQLADLVGNIKGVKGDSADTLQNFGGSLFRNLNYEEGNFTGFGNTSFLELNGTEDGKNVIKVTASKTGNLNYVIRPNTRRLYKLSVFAKSTTTTTQINFFPLDSSKTVINQSGGTSIFCLNVPVSGSFTQLNGFIGGIGTASTNFEANTVFLNIFINNSTTGILEYHSLNFSIVDLGEPVPHNLVWLPIGQTVVDNTTGKVGRYNGTTIDWYM